MFDSSKNSENSLAFLKKLFTVLFLVSVGLLTACSSQVVVKKQEVNQECVPEGEAYTEIEIKKQQLTDKCWLKGIIEIDEQYSIRTDTRDLFEEAVSLLKSDKYHEAIEVLNRVVETEKKFTAPYINLGIAYFRTAELKKAEKFYLKALKLNAVHPVANNELGMLYRKTGRYAEARERYEMLLNENPGFMPARRNLGMLCDLYLQDLNCAHQQYDIFLQDNPGDEQVKNWMLDLKSRM
jgi:tetratricopeptide (TPR) repeat protein